MTSFAVEETITDDPIEELTEAIRLTAEYVGPRTLPAVKGWSWFDALSKYAPEKALPFVAESESLEESNFVTHARRELTALGEDQETIAGYLKVMQAYSEMGHSGGSHSVAVSVIYELLQFNNLTPLTNNPEEWFYHGEDVWGSEGGVWQNIRNGEAFSHDGGKTYYLLSEGGNDRNRKPLHEAKQYEE